ncbi:hypothetical protein M0G74_16610 [Microbulbifer sp. CAU 1566]|uniref:hypothetical protein n=1 Tax=Microbulbifer sp. CAU 1566 TaxID=2933269 RepID=UPI002004081F|nr:hypothetical protein [Microbulbifer sp. CAU 1566]MCK7598897.1 hypothetical protein [Microbulbifer sp. CAU 1566]
MSKIQSTTRKSAACNSVLYPVLLAGFLPLSSVVWAQQEMAAEADLQAAVEAAEMADLDITLQVIEDTESAQDLLNNIELPDEVREIAEQKLAAALAAIKAMREAQPGGQVPSGDSAASSEAMLAEMAERRAELMNNAQNSALAANEQAQQAVESAREAVEEALKNGLTNAEMQGMIEQMMQDILGVLPEEARGSMGDVDTLLDSLRGDVASEPVSDTTDGTGG